MIVRCNNCESAFAVDDEKVANKKFAFNCPKCSSENIIDNRTPVKKSEEKKLKPEEPFFNDFADDTISNRKAGEQTGTPESSDDDLFYNESPVEKKSDLFEDENSAEFSDDYIVKEKKERKLNLEIEPSEDFPEFEGDDILAEKVASSKKKKDEDTLDESISFNTEEDFRTFDEKKSSGREADEFGIELKEDTVKTEDDDIFLDDFEETPKKQNGKEKLPDNNLLSEDAEFGFEDLDSLENAEKTKNDREIKLSSQDDIDALFAEEGIKFEEEPISRQSEKAFEDEITVDLDSLDIEFEGADGGKQGTGKPVIAKSDQADNLVAEEIDFEAGSLNSELFEEPVRAGKSKDKPLEFEEDITLDIDNLDIDLDEPASKVELFEEPVRAGKSKDKSLGFEEDITLDIDNLDIDLDEPASKVELFEEPVRAGKSKDNSLGFEEDITLDIDNLDIDLDEPASKVELFEEPVRAGKSKDKSLELEDDITLDIDNLDIDLDEPASKVELFDEPVKAGKQRDKSLELEDDITLDIDNLDIDLDEPASKVELFEEPVKAGKQRDKSLELEDDITLDIDNLDIDLDEPASKVELFEEPVKAGKKRDKSLELEDDITLDIDNLDIDLDEPASKSELYEEPVRTVKSNKNINNKEIFPEDEFSEEDIKLNLDDLDIDLEEIENRELIFEDDVIEKHASVQKKKVKPILEEPDEDESITIDLDTLELEIAEEKSAKKEEISEEDEKLTLDDAGLTFDELTSGSGKVALLHKEALETASDEDIKLMLDEIDPDLTLDKIAQSGKVETERVTDTLDELPEIDLDEYDTIVRQEENRPATEIVDHFEDELSVFQDTGKSGISRPDYDMFEYEESDQEKALSENGNTLFSIDLSLKYSRIGALLRLLGLYSLSMIPHFVVMFVYTLLSSILGFINQIVILSTGRFIEDFAMIIENTMRYFFYIETCITGIVEDRPVYAGRESIDHPLQLNITYPIKYSKNLAIMRLSIIGIMLIMLPHLLIMSFITISVPFVYLAGIISVIATRRWPNILFIYLTKYFRYLAKISAFITGLTDEYPPFNFD